MLQHSPHEVDERNGGGVGVCSRDVARFLGEGGLGQLELLVRGGHLGEDRFVSAETRVFFDRDVADGPEAVCSVW